MKTNLKESSIMTDMQGVLASKGILWTATHATDRLFSSLCFSIAEFLSAYKKPDNKISVIIKDEKGNFLIAGIVDYHSNQNEDDDEVNKSENFSFVMTFDEKDCEDCNEKYTVFDNQFQVIAQEASKKHSSFTFMTNESIVLVFSAVVEAMKKWLDTNASETEVVSLEIPDVFTASVEVVDGNKIYAIEPIGSCKRIAKGDIDIANNK